MLSTIGIILDIIVLSILAIAGIIGFKKGFLKSILALFSWIACVLLAVLLAKHVARLLNGIYDFSALIGNKITSGLAKQGEFFNNPINSFGYESKEQLIANIPASTNKMLTQLIKVVINSAKVDVTTSESSVASVVGLSLGNIIMVIVAGILIFAVLKIVVFLLTKFFDKITSVKVIGILNKILGTVFGVLKAGVIIIVFNSVLVLLSLIPFVNKTIKPLVQENTVIERVIYNETDKIVGKYLIEGDLVKGWVSNVWHNR